MRRIATLALITLLVMTACRKTDEAPVPATPQDAPVEPGAPVTPEPAMSQPAAIGEVVTLAVDTLDGKRFDLAAQRGQWVVVNYWATWCGPCLEEMPELSALDAMREHIQVVGLTYEDIQADELRAFLDKHPVVYPIAIIDPAAPPAAFEAPRGLPMTHLIAPDGTLAKSFVGPVTAKSIEDAIAAAGGPQPVKA